ncbi:GNAT family N-acetyltransferase [Mycobacterium dioxanotrophicus]|uniref:GNAT family N-acetyltransferase n=1 Tax=Mycobacterium dioxanotrophicus TaxID=482462 RepID=A0A1Y0C672_9MYCO|nr:N-acetyltransferase [Mycobacterium dioxanotrophicus]ART70709.1 GNAT family N-acetyltransferase [Mycobacterium dioxanotrophicus]
MSTDAVVVDQARRADLPELAAVAAATFPLACPPSSTPENIAAFIAENLSEERFGGYLGDPERVLLVARDGAAHARSGNTGAITGYAMMIRGVPDDDDVQRAVNLRPAIELSKIYVLPDQHGAGAATALMTEALQRAATLGFSSVWLGVNQKNERAQRFYRKHGFTVNGTKTFRLGAGIENDYVMVRPV